MACIERSVGGNAFTPIHANDNFDRLSRADPLSGCVEMDLILPSDESIDFSNLVGNTLASIAEARNRIDPRDLFVDFDIIVADQFCGGPCAMETPSGDTRENSSRNEANDFDTLTGVTNVTADDLLVPSSSPL